MMREAGQIGQTDAQTGDFTEGESRAVCGSEADENLSIWSS
jgi:hypothetical protein